MGKSTINTINGQFSIANCSSLPEGTSSSGLRTIIPATHGETRRIAHPPAGDRHREVDGTCGAARHGHLASVPLRWSGLVICLVVRLAIIIIIYIYICTWFYIGYVYIYIYLQHAEPGNQSHDNLDSYFWKRSGRCSTVVTHSLTHSLTHTLHRAAVHVQKQP